MVAPTSDDVRAHLTELRSRATWSDPAAFGIGIATLSGDKVLDTYYGAVNRDENHGFAALVADVTGHDGASGTVVLEPQHVQAIGERLAPIVADGGWHPNADVAASLADLDTATSPITGTR